MKKLFSFLMIAAMLIVASCNRPEEGKDIVREGDLATVTFTVNAGDILTKAPAEVTYGNAALIDQLLVQVFNLDGEEFKKLESPEIDITPVEATTPTWDVQMKLAKNETYKIAFWAQKAGNTIYDTADLSKVTVDYTKMDINGENADYADVFCAARHLTVSGSLAETVELYRPLAQVNVAANDLVAYEKSVLGTKKTLKADITLPKTTTPCKLDVIGGTVAEDGVVTYKVTGYLENDQVFENVEIADSEHVQRFKSNDVGYDFLTMVYMLANPTKETIDFNIKIKNPATIINDLKVSNMPFQANYRTNIVGQLLTGSFEYTVEVEEGFFGIFEKKVAPTFESIADLNAYLATLKTGPLDADNGDIFPEEVVVEEVGEVATITLPNDTLSVAITILKPYDAELTIAYPTAEGAKHSNNVYLNIGGLTKLSANLTDTHMEIMAGSDIDLSDVHTSTSTFVVRKGARVGTVKIQQGNANIAGEVDLVEVVAGATADGTNPVEVFLEKESAVTHIDLNAPANVVVEQPADNIDKAATENKVSVDVNVNGCSATAQNGGQIYVNVKGENVTCDVAADGADGSEPSTVTIASVEEGSAVHTETSDGGVIETKEGTEGQVAAYVAQNKTTEVKYTSLEAAFAAAEENQEIIVLADCEVKANIPVNFDLTLNVAGYTITNNVTGNRMFRVGGEGTMLEIKGGNGKIVIPESNKDSYGFVDLRNQQNEASYYAGLKASNVDFNGATTGGSFFQARTHYQQFLFENVNVDCTDGDGIVYGGYANGLNASIINCYNCQICTVSIKGGTFKYASRGVNYGVFQDYFNAFTTLEDVTVISTDGPVNQGMSYSCLIKNCNFANPNNVNAWDWTNTCICASNNKTIEVDGGSYEGNYACYVYTSGGTIHIKGGSFIGRTAALIAQVDNNSYATASSNIIVDGGTFNGPIKMDQGANCSITINAGTFTAEAGKLFGPMYGTLSIKGGTFSEDPSAYVAAGYSAIDNGDGTWTVIEGEYCPYDSNKTAAQNGKALYDKIMALPDGGKLKVAPGYYEWDNGQSRMNWAPVNKSITIEGMGNPEDITIATVTGGRYGIVLQATVEGVVVTIKNVTFTGAASNTGFLHPIYVKDYMTLNLENVICKSTTANKYGLLLDSSNTHVKGVTTTVNAKGVRLDEGKWVGLMAKPRSDAYPAYSDENLYVTYCKVNILDGCNFTADNCEPQNGALSTGYNLLVNDVPFARDPSLDAEE